MRPSTKATPGAAWPPVEGGTWGSAADAAADFAAVVAPVGAADADAAVDAAGDCQRGWGPSASVLWLCAPGVKAPAFADKVVVTAGAVSAGAGAGMRKRCSRKHPSTIGGYCSLVCMGAQESHAQRIAGMLAAARAIGAAAASSLLCLAALSGE